MQLPSARARRHLRHGALLAIASLSVTPTVADAAAEGPAIFVDRAADWGLDFRHVNGMTGRLLLPEITGAGAALLDYDNDGDLDAYLVQGGPLPAESAGAGEAPGDQLFRNRLATDSARGPRFQDVTRAARIRETGYGMGVAVGDVDNDGWPDLFISNLGPDRLLRNNGDGTYNDVSAAAGIRGEGWSTSAAFLDYDADGWLDLYVAHYVRDPVPGPECFATSTRRDYCGPDAYPFEADELYRGRGDGTFEPAVGALPPLPELPGLGVTSLHANNDARIDLYVANDGQANFLLLNRGDGTFLEDALMAGAAFNREGRAEASMGVTAGDYDGDGDDDLFMTHLDEETNTLYANDGNGLFEDRTVQTGLAPVGLSETGFGTGWLDYDNDGWPDLLILNGAVRLQEDLIRAGDPFPLGQPNRLLRSAAGRRFEPVPATRAGASFALTEVSRGAAFGDIDNDGDVDVLVTNNNGPARLLVNEVGADSRWLGIQVAGRGSHRDAYGARLELLRADGTAIWRRVGTDGSYLSASDRRVLLGLGQGETIVSIRVHWPDGRTSTHPVGGERRYVQLREPVSGGNS